MLSCSPIWPKNRSVHFIHNWRCAGTTVNSILSSNFHENYLKIGHPFTTFGWPHDYENHPEPLLTVGQIRSLVKSSQPKSVILGGHTFLGLESLLTGPFDIWMNYRDPLQRLNSGILRFYNKQYKTRSGSTHLIDVSHSLESTALDFPAFVDQLLSSTLVRESNGISRRLAALALSNSIEINQSTNVETVDFLLSGYSDKDLFECALSRLSDIKVLINSSYIQASLICIERIYGLSSPLINPFSNLSHNPVTLSGAKKSDTSIIDQCHDILIKHSQADLKLLPHLHSSFANQVNSVAIDEKEISVRNAIHQERLFMPKWFTFERFSHEDVTRLISESLEKLCRNNSSLDTDILSTFFKWNGLDLDIRTDVNRYLTDRFSRPSFI